jgi:hypothetical protein
VVDKASNTTPVNKKGMPASTRALMEEEFFFMVELSLIVEFINNSV